MTTTLLDPTAELQPAARQLNDRLASLKGMTVGLLDISKPRGKEFLDEVAALHSEAETLLSNLGGVAFAIADTGAAQTLLGEAWLRDPAPAIAGGPSAPRAAAATAAVLP